MRRSKVEVFVHIVWSTLKREPLVVPSIERAIYRCIENEARKLGCVVLAADGMSDHAHLVVKLHSRVCVAELARKTKGVSSTMARDISPAGWFGWQDGYGAFSVSKDDLDRVIDYVRRQKEHHAAGTTIPEWEETGEEIDDPQ